jgi:hypothetical protein
MSTLSCRFCGPLLLIAVTLAVAAEPIAPPPEEPEPVVPVSATELLPSQPPSAVPVPLPLLTQPAPEVADSTPLTSPPVPAVDGPISPPGTQFGLVGPPGLNGPLSGIGGRGFGGPFGLANSLTPFVSYSATWYPNESATGGSHLGFVRQEGAFNYPLYADDQNYLIGHVGVREEKFQTDVILPDSGQAFPHELWNVHFGVNGLHRFDSGWSAGGGISFGSASDRPFDSFKTLNLGVNGFLRIPVRDQRDAWLFTLAYSPLGQLTFPVPGVAYNWNPSKQLTVNFGLPAQVYYRPTPDWIFEASYMLVTNVRARVSYRLNNADWLTAARLYAGYEWTNESYYLSSQFPQMPGDSSDSFQRFFYYEQRLAAGIYYPVNRNLAFDLSAGYAFDRYYIRGKSISSGIDHVDVGAGAFISGQVRLRW